MVGLKIKYLSSCELTEKHENMDSAIARVNELFDIYSCFYGSQNGLASQKKLKLLSVPSFSDVVLQVMIPPDQENRYQKEKLLVIFRISEEIQK